LPRNITSYIYKDYGSGHFGATDFEHLFDTKVTGGTNSGFCAAHMLANAVNDAKKLETVDNDHHIKLTLVNSGGGANSGYRLEEWLGSQAIDSDITLTFNTNHYHKFSLVVATKALTDEIFSDVDRTTLLVTLSLTLRAAATWQYQYSAASWNTGASVSLSGIIANTDLQEVVLEAAKHYSTSIYDKNFNAFDEINSKYTII
jgi:hypothetical protein